MALIQHHGPIASSTELGVSWKEVFFKTLFTSTYNRLQIMHDPCLLTPDPAVLHACGGVFSVCGFGDSALQYFKCVCEAWTHIVCIHKLTFCLHPTRHSCFVFSVLWCGCSVVELSFYLPILTLASMHCMENKNSTQMLLRDTVNVVKKHQCHQKHCENMGCAVGAASLNWSAQFS